MNVSLRDGISLLFPQEKDRVKSRVLFIWDLHPKHQFSVNIQQNLIKALYILLWKLVLDDIFVICQEGYLSRSAMQKNVILSRELESHKTGK